MKRSQIQPTEFLPFYTTYIDNLGDIELLEALDIGKKSTVSFFRNIPKSKFEFRYQESKWTPKEILLHLIDTERVFSYRALTFARTKNAELPGFDQDVFAANSYANEQSMDILINEYTATRNATILLYESMGEIVLKQTGIANGGNLSVAAAGFIICGHEKHHCQIIKDRYL